MAGRAPNGPSPAFGDFLNAVASRREDLHVHVLAWDFAIYALEWEPLPCSSRAGEPIVACTSIWTICTRWAGSHHQKVVVDDAVAFAGLDPT